MESEARHHGGVYRVCFRLTGLPRLPEGTNWICRNVQCIHRAVRRLQLAADYDRDDFGTPFSRGIRIVAELVADCREEAVSIAAEASDTIARVIGFCAGVPHTRAHVVSLLDATPGVKKRAFTQWAYDVVPAAPSREVQVSEIETIIDSLNSRPPREAEGITRGLKWYTDALDEHDPVDRFLKAWVGLESIGSILNRRVHRSGWSNCAHCLGSQEDRSRDEKQERGIRHLFSVVEPSIPDLFGRLKKIRNKLVHAEWPLEKVRREVEPLLHAVMKGLCSGLLTAMPPAGTKGGSRQALEPVRTALGGPQLRVSLDVLSQDPDIWGELDAKFVVKATLESSALHAGQYVGRMGLRVEGESPCPVENVSAESELPAEHGMELTVDSQSARLHIRDMRADAAGSQPSGPSSGTDDYGPAGFNRQ